MAETALNRSYRRRLQQLRAAALRRATAADTSDTSRFIERVVPIVLAAQAATVAAADAYLSAEAGLATGSSTDPWGLDPRALIGVRGRRGDTLESVYARNHRSAVSTFAERMAREVNTDITLADRAATFVHTEGDTRITGYRRSLSAGKNCTLCVAASTMTYRKGDLRPIHAHCACTTQPIYGGDTTNWRRPSPAALRSLYEQAGATTGSATRIRPTDPSLPEVEVVESVLGPTLVAA